ncbi:MAG: LamG domain-containing protein [Planctomycetes bacterium]|nr:LamG domain-containing protein [Planctomycetota bacterium]
MIWSTHGSATVASGVMKSSNASALDNTHPGATFQSSCSNAAPSHGNNLAYALLKNGAITTVAATTFSWYQPGNNDYKNIATCGGMAYQYAMRLTEGQACGEALCDLKETLPQWKSWLKNYYVMCLYGDPSIVVLPETPAFTVAPTDLFHAVRVEGETSYNEERIYTLQNRSDHALEWIAGALESWVECEPASGVVPADGTSEITVRILPSVDDLPWGEHTAELNFGLRDRSYSVKRPMWVRASPRSLIGHWRLDDESGRLAADTSMHAHHGDLEGGVFSFDISSEPGKFDDALRLDGEDDCIRTNALDLYGNQMTITAWIKPEGIQSNGTGIAFYKGSKSEAGLFLLNNNKLAYAWKGLSWSGDVPLIAPEGSWSLVALTVNPDQAMLYLINPDQGTYLRTTHDVPSVMELFDSSFYLGCKAKTGGTFFEGALDDIRVYNYPLDAYEIKVLSRGGPAVNPLPDNGKKDVCGKTVQWIPGSGAIENRVYLGTVFEAVASADQDCALFRGAVNAGVYRFKSLERKTEYFWRVDTVTPDEVIKGKVWSFSTGRFFLPVDLRSGLVTHYTMDDAHIEGDTLYDVSGEPYYDGTIIDAVPSAPGIMKEALEFDGDKDYVSIPALHLNSNTITFSAWLCSDVVHLAQRGIAVCNDGSSNAGLIFSGNNKLAYIWSGAYKDWDSNLVLPVAQWSHVALAVGLEEATLYLNGYPATHIALHEIEEFDGELWLGGYQGWNRWFDGCMDEFTLWNRALNKEEILTLYSSVIMGFGSR